MQFLRRAFPFLLVTLVGTALITCLVPAVRCFVVLQLGLGTENAKLACKLNQSLDEHAARGFSGAVLVVKDGQVLVDRGYGMANYEHDVPNTPKTKFRIGSVTKPFTATAIMQLQERGLLSVDDPISKYLPDFPNGDKIRIHHLLTHTSGIQDFRLLAGYDEAVRDRVISSDELMGVIKNGELGFQPGERYKYSNSGYIMLARIIELSSGKSYEKFLQENVFTPAGMHSTCFDRHDHLIKNRAAGYIFTSIEQKDFNNAHHFDISWLTGSGNLLSTTGDLYRFDRALNNGVLLSDDSWKAMISPYVQADPDPGYYGYGWLTNSDGQGHEGGSPGTRAIFLCVPSEDLCVVIFSNKVAPANEPLAVALDLIKILEPYGNLRQLLFFEIQEERGRRRKEAVALSLPTDEHVRLITKAA